MGNRAGFIDFFGDIKTSTHEVGCNTYVYAAFDPEVTGKQLPLPPFSPFVRNKMKVPKEYRRRRKKG